MATKAPKRPRDRPALKALDRSGKNLAEKVFQAHLEQLSRHVERNGVGGLRKLYAQARGEIVARLRKFGTGSKQAEAVQLRAMLAQVDAVMENLGKEVAKLLQDTGRASVELGAQHGVDEFRVLAKQFTGTVPIVNVDVPATFGGLVKGVDRSLLRRYRRQAQTWSLRAIDRIEQQLKVATMTGQQMDRVVDEVLGLKGFEGERWQAERIVRTEAAYAHGASKQRAMELTQEELGGPLHKRLIETFDDRTGDDSFLLHGQTVPIDKPFRWKAKRGGKWVVIDYMHPPNRPNDRAVVIPWDPTWEETPEESPLTKAELRAARPTRWRKHAGVQIPPGHKPGKPY